MHREIVQLVPCPFCEGPPCVIVQNDTSARGVAPIQEDYGVDGIPVSAFVFCHECGATGPARDVNIFDREDYLTAEAAAVALWQTRDARHRPMFDAGANEGLNLYPREEHG